MCELRDGGEDWGNISNDCEFAARRIIWDNKRKCIRSSNKLPNNDDFRMFVLFPQHLTFLCRKHNVLMKDADCDISCGRIKFSQDYLSSFISVVGQRETVTVWDGIASHSSTPLCRLVSGWSLAGMHSKPGIAGGEWLRCHFHWTPEVSGVIAAFLACVNDKPSWNVLKWTPVNMQSLPPSALQMGQERLRVKIFIPIWYEQ